jgi:hypothetical protein
LAQAVSGRQAEFRTISEEWGEVSLSDGATVRTRVILSDLVIIAEDVLGPQVALSPVIILRVICPTDLKEKVKDKPVLTRDRIVPVTREDGFEKIDVREIKTSAKSVYQFDSYELILELTIDSVARSMSYKNVSGAPAYATRFSINKQVKKMPEPQ